jgi:hypothetical protein
MAIEDTVRLNASTMRPVPTFRINLLQDNGTRVRARFLADCPFYNVLDCISRSSGMPAHHMELWTNDTALRVIRPRQPFIEMIMACPTSAGRQDPGDLTNSDGELIQIQLSITKKAKLDSEATNRYLCDRSPSPDFEPGDWDPDQDPTDPVPNWDPTWAGSWYLPREAHATSVKDASNSEDVKDASNSEDSTPHDNRLALDIEYSPSLSVEPAQSSAPASPTDEGGEPRSSTDEEGDSRQAASSRPSKRGASPPADSAKRTHVL